MSLQPRLDGGGDVRGVVLCADDFGLTDGVSRGILDLAERGRISATSAITTRPHWRAHAPALRALGERVAAGLHLNLTTAAPLGPMPLVASAGALPPLQDLLQRAFLGLLPPAEIRAEIDRQLDAFAEAFGAPPAFVDGHQHVHVLPVIRPALLAALKERGLAGKVWLRDPSDGALAIVRREVSANKALVVKALAIGFRRAARAAGFDTNEGFSGFSPLDGSAAPERVFEQAVLNLGPRPVVMAHPGWVDDALRELDPAVESRPRELAYLESGAFDRLLADQDRVLAARPG